MRRELKGRVITSRRREVIRFSSCPDEEGTESSGLVQLVDQQQHSFSSCPDEEGTESLADEEAEWDGPAFQQLSR